jgi:hypothetical protein
MPFQVFISYATQDRVAANAVCAALEQSEVRCWIAPRDIQPGADWAQSIVEAIQATRILVLIFSRHSNGSQQVAREVSGAVGLGNVIIPVRIEDVLPSGSMQYYLSTPHWLDAMSPPLERHLEGLSSAVVALLGTFGGSREEEEKKERPKSSALPYEPLNLVSEGEVELDQLGRTGAKGGFLRWVRRLIDDK